MKKGPYKASRRSAKYISECHTLLRPLVYGMLNYVDLTVTCGYRSPKTQDKLYNTIMNGKRVTNARGGQSKHNIKPSLAIDVVIYLHGDKNTKRGISWNKLNAYMLAGRMQQLADMMYGKGIIRVGSDWDQDNDASDQNLHDPFHIEVIDEDFIPDQARVDYILSLDIWY